MATAPPEGEFKHQENPLVQYIVVRKDLLKKPFSWSNGAIVSNSCHASLAVIAENWSHENVQLYLKNHIRDADTTILEGGEPNSSLFQMYKVVLAAQNEEELLKTQETLNKENINHHLWVEQPEGIPTALAVMPYRREFIAPFLKSLRLFR
uniref:peptidyl-tRNA hydrolase n=1 Tax=Paramoeba aestuarina TaxID=180227 RepID=A0A7S4KYL5_9EUKA